MLVSKPEYDDNFTPEIEQRYLNLLEKIDQRNNQYKLTQRYYINIEDEIKKVQPACLKTSFPTELVKLRKQQESILKKGRISKKFLTKSESVVSLSEAIFLLAYVRHNFNTLSFFNFQVLLGKIENALKKQEELDAHLHALGINAQKHAAKGGKGKAQAANTKSNVQLEAHRESIQDAITNNWGRKWKSIADFLNWKSNCIISTLPKNHPLALDHNSVDRKVRRWFKEDSELMNLFIENTAH